MPDEVVVNGKRYRPVDEDAASLLAQDLHEFTLEGKHFWKKFFIERQDGMYVEGDESQPFFSEAFLYNLLGKDEARSVLGMVRRLSVLAGVRFEN